MRNQPCKDGPRARPIGALIIILSLAAYLRLANVATNPAWYTDEGTHLDIARHLLTGRVQYLAINQSLLLFSRMPVFEWLLAYSAHLTGVNMTTLRTLTGLLGVATVALMYVVVRHVTRGQDRTFPLLAALMMAIYPPAVLYSRFGFSYNLLAPLVLMALLGAWEYSATRRRTWLALSALSIGLGTLSDLWMFTLILPLAIVISMRKWRDILCGLLLTLLPFGLYAVVMLGTVPQAFQFDLRFVLSRLNQLPWGQQLATLLQNVTILAAQDIWMVLGVSGLVLLKTPRLRFVTLLFFSLPLIELGRTTALFSLSYYYMIPLLPLVALGMASLIRYGVPWVKDALARRMNSPDDYTQPAQASWRGATVLFLSIAVAVPFAVSTLHMIDQIQNGFRTDIDPFLINPGDAQNATAYLNQYVTENDTVIASPAMAWQIRSNVADFQMPLAARGQSTPHLPGNLPPDRFTFDPGYRQVRFVVVDNLWRNWATPNVLGLAAMLKYIETWPAIFKSGAVVVYQNPQ